MVEEQEAEKNRRELSVVRDMKFPVQIKMKMFKQAFSFFSRQKVMDSNINIENMAMHLNGRKVALCKYFLF